jgi:hypothetical protein
MVAAVEVFMGGNSIEFLPISQDESIPITRPLGPQQGLISNTPQGTTVDPRDQSNAARALR